MNPEAEAYIELVALISATWPSVTAVYRQSSLARTNWVRLVGSGALVTPFAVVESGPSTPEVWGLDNACWRWSVGIVLVVATSDSTDVAGYLQGLLASLRSALIGYSGTGFQCAGDDPTIDVTSGNSANQALLGLQASKFAGELRCRLLVGGSVNS